MRKNAKKLIHEVTPKPNFTPYQTEQFAPFAPAALTAERLYAIDPAACVFSCRKAMELAVKWMYACDRQLVMPYKKDLAVLLSTVEFVDLVDDKNLLRRLDFLRRLGNTAAHSAEKISRDQARLALENLFYFLDFIACCYAPDYEPHDFDPALLQEMLERFQNQWIPMENQYFETYKIGENKCDMVIKL